MNLGRNSGRRRKTGAGSPEKVESMENMFNNEWIQV